MNIEIFNITWRNISDNLVPYFWRNVDLYREDAHEPTWFAEYVYCVLNSITNLTNRLFELAFDVKRRVNYNGQVTVLEFALNDYFDDFERRIFITDAGIVAFALYLQGEPNPDEQDIYLHGETNPYPFDLFMSLESTGLYDFYVNIPSGVSFDIDRMRQIISYYRLGGKRYEIITY